MPENAFSKFVRENTQGPVNRVFIGAGIAEIAQSNNKLRETVKLVRDLALWRITWPAALLGGLVGVRKVIAELVRDSGSLKAAWDKMGQINGIRAQFQALMGSSIQAKQRVAELIQVGQKRIVPLENLAEASRGMTILSRGALGASGDLNRVVTAARASGRGLTEVGDATAGLYRDLQDGRPIDAAASALEQMGLMTTENVRHLANLQQTGATFSSQWKYVTDTLDAASESGKGFEQSLEGLEKQLEQAHARLYQRAGEPFLEGERRGLEASIELAKNLEGPLGKVADNLARVVNVGKGAGTKVAAMLSGIPGATTAADFLSNGVIGGAIGLGGIAVRAGGRVLGGAWNAVRGFDLGGRGRALRMAAGGRSGLRGALMDIGGGVMESASAGFSAVRGAAGGIAELGLHGFTQAALIMKLADLMDVTGKRNAALKDLKSANTAEVEDLRKQIDGVKNLADAQRALVVSTQTLAAARDRLAKLTAKTGVTIGNLVSGADLRDDRAVSSQGAQVRILAAEQRRALEAGMAMPFGSSEEQQAFLQQRSARNLRLGEVARRQAIERSSGFQRASLLEGEAQRAERESEQARLYASESARLENLKKLASAGGDARILFRGANGVEQLGTAQEAYMAARRASPSSMMQSEQRLEDMRSGAIGATQQQIAAAEAEHKARMEYMQSRSPEEGPYWRQQARAALLDASLRETDIAGQRGLNSLALRGRERAEGEMRVGIETLQSRRDALRGTGDNEQEVRALNGQIEARRRELALMQQEYDVMERRASVEKEIARLTTRGEERAQQEYHLRKALLDEEEKNAPDQGTRDRISAEKAELLRQRRESQRQYATNESAIQRDLRVRQLNREGGGDQAVRLSDLSAFAQHYESALGGGESPEQAKGTALAQTHADIADSFAALARSGVVDSLQRIGGGGGVAEDSYLTEAKRQSDLQEAANEYLRQIAETIGQNPTTGGEPDVPFD